MFKAFFRITGDGQIEKWGWLDEDGPSEIPGVYELSVGEETPILDDAQYDEMMKKNIKIIDGDVVLQELLQQEMKPIKLGIAPNGFDTNSVSEGFIEQMEMRGVHRGCWSLYASAGGRAYRMHCSSFEMKCMAEEYDAEQRTMVWLKKEGFQMVDIDDDSDIRLQNLVGYWGPVGSCKDFPVVNE